MHVAKGLAMRDAFCNYRRMSTPPKTHAEILESLDLRSIAKGFGLSLLTVKSWRDRDSIPAPYWRRLIKAAPRGKLITYDALAAAAERRFKKGVAA
jgi:hypothetical protein